MDAKKRYCHLKQITKIHRRKGKHYKAFNELTYPYFKKLTQENCYYCGQIDKYNGIDRVDNNEGYSYWNSRACCSRCNRMKSKMTLDEFLEQVRKIHDNW